MSQNILLGNYADPTKIPEEMRADPNKRVFNNDTYLTFDQSLTHTGWAVVDVYTQHVLACDVINYKDSKLLKGFELTFDKAARLEEALEPLITKWAPMVDEILLEMPAVIGMRTESSLMGAEKIYTVCRRQGLPKPTLISRQHAAAVVCKDGRADKKKTGAEVDKLILKRPDGARWNEHIRDAVLLALSHGLEMDERPFPMKNGTV